MPGAPKMAPNDLKMRPRSCQDLPKWSLKSPSSRFEVQLVDDVVACALKSSNGIQCASNGSQDPPKDLQSLQKVSPKVSKDLQNTPKLKSKASSQPASQPAPNEALRQRGSVRWGAWQRGNEAVRQRGGTPRGCVAARLRGCEAVSLW